MVGMMTMRRIRPKPGHGSRVRCRHNRLKGHRAWSASNTWLACIRHSFCKRRHECRWQELGAGAHLSTLSAYVADGCGGLDGGFERREAAAAAQMEVETKNECRQGDAERIYGMRAKSQEHDVDDKVRRDRQLVAGRRRHGRLGRTAPTGRCRAPHAEMKQTTIQYNKAADWRLPPSVLSDGGRTHID
jgi:hypothetical protein